MAVLKSSKITRLGKKNTCSTSACCVFTQEDLPDYISKSINEYNSEKPHYVHKIYTPDEIHHNPELKNTKLLFDKLNQQRIQENQNYSCGKVCF